jgi:hypothetical protein
MTDFSLNGMTIPGTAVICWSEQSIASRVDEGTVILNRTSGTYSSLDATGSIIWNHLREPISLTRLVDRILQEYDVGESRCIDDLQEFLGDLLENRLIVIRDAAGIEIRPR